MCVLFGTTMLLLAVNVSARSIEDAADHILSQRYDEAFALLENPMDDSDEEMHRQLLLGLYYATHKRQDEASDVLHGALSSAKPVIEQRHAVPVYFYEMNESKQQALDEFLRMRFNHFDSSYIRRSLWQYAIATRITKNANTDLERFVIILDYVYRHVAFGTNGRSPMNEKPFNVLVRGEGYCNEVAHCVNQLMRCVGLDVYRLILRDPPQEKSPHTASLLRLESNAIVFDASNGIILQDAFNRMPESYPLQFSTMSERYDETVVSYEHQEAAMNAYCDALSEFGISEDLVDGLRYAHVFIDREKETCAPRFLALDHHLKQLGDIPGLAEPYVPLVQPVYSDATQSIKGWDVQLMPSLFGETHEHDQMRLDMRDTVYGMFRPLEHARLALLRGEFADAAKAFDVLAQDHSLTDEARERAQYYRAVCAFESGDMLLAKTLFDTFITDYAQSLWRERAFYHLLRIADAEGDDARVMQLQEKAKQNHSGALYHWMQVIQGEGKRGE